jgi:hypothetical protein
MAKRTEILQALNSMVSGPFCDAPDCLEPATHRARLAKSNAEVCLCSRHVTRFAVRGLIATVGTVLTNFDLDPLVAKKEVRTHDEGGGNLQRSEPGRTGENS